MILKHINSQSLISTLKTLVSEERRITLQILHYLREVEARRLFEPHYPSLFEFCVRELGYSNDAAYRRISAMRTLKELPAIESKIESGVLSLTVVAQAAKFFRAEASSRKEAGAPVLAASEKFRVFTALEGKSTRQAEVVLSAHASVPVETRAVQVELSSEDYEKLLKLQALFSHRPGGDTVSGVISLLLKEGFERHSPERVAARSKASLRAPEVKPEVVGLVSRVSHRRYISAPVKRAVWLRDGGQCSMKGCGATRYLHFDHYIPHALGGASTPENLRLLCSAHNRAEAALVFGRWRP